MKKHLVLSSLAAAVALATSVTAQQSFTFAPPDYVTGTIVGQNGWFGGGGNATNNALVAERAFIVSDPGDPFNNQWLELRGSRTVANGGTGKMDAFASVPLGGTPVSFSMDLIMAPEIAAADPAELFIRFNGWNSYVALKLTADLVEFPGTSLTDAGLLADTWYNFRVDYNAVGGMFTSADIYLNNTLAGTVSGFSIDPSAGVNLELRSQNTLTVIDNFSVIPEPSTYAALFGLFAIGLVLIRRRLRK